MQFDLAEYCPDKKKVYFYIKASGYTLKYSQISKDMGDDPITITGNVSNFCKVNHITGGMIHNGRILH